MQCFWLKSEFPNFYVGYNKAQVYNVDVTNLCTQCCKHDTQEQNKKYAVEFTVCQYTWCSWICAL